MKTLKPILSLFAITAIACSNTNSSASSTLTPTDSAVTTEQDAEEVSGIRVPDIKLDSLGEIHDKNLLNLFSYDTNIRFSTDGKPVVTLYNSHGLENTERIKRVDIQSLYYHMVKKGDEYYDPETDSGKTAEKDIKVYECESGPYSEFYEFDSQNRLIKYGYGCDFHENSFYIFVSYKYGADGNFSYKYEQKDTEATPFIVNGKWDGAVWTEEIQMLDESQNKFNSPITYALRPVPGHPGFFTVNTLDGNNPISIAFRHPYGYLLRRLKPGETIFEERLKKDNYEKIKEDKDSHGNYRKVTVIDPDGCNQEIHYTISYR